MGKRVLYDVESEATRTRFWLVVGSSVLHAMPFGVGSYFKERELQATLKTRHDFLVNKEHPELVPLKEDLTIPEDLTARPDPYPPKFDYAPREDNSTYREMKYQRYLDWHYYWGPLLVVAAVIFYASFFV